MNLDTREKIVAQRRQELLHEMEMTRLVKNATRNHPTLGRRIVGNVGKSLVSLGTKLEQVDPRNQLLPASSTRRGGPSLSASGRLH